MDCSVCGKQTERSTSFQHKCSHWTHSECIADENNLNIHKCQTCETGIEKEFREPHTSDGIDYVQFPGKKPTESFRATISSLWGSKKSTAAAATKKAPIDLINSRVPIETIMVHHNYGLDHMLKDGINIDDFITNRYGWPDLCKFEAISKEGPKRCLDALTRGLGVTANHLRDHPDLLPFGEIKKATQMEPRHMCEFFGLAFPDCSSLSCFGDTNWNAKHCVQFGLTTDDLICFGLEYVEQYADLMQGLTKREAEKAERDLKTTKEQLEGLQSVEETPLPHTPQEYEEEEEEEQIIEEQQQRIVAVPPQKVAAEKIRHIPPSYLKKKVEIEPTRRPSPFSRHGYKK